jgi:hypothetical protein
MAENKKGFILYADQRSIIEMLDDETAGKLLKHIYSYVNDENPVSDNPLINLAFEPIKLQLKRDLKTWESIKSKRSNAGRAGASKRWQNIAKDGKGILPIAKIAVNDNVKVNVINIPPLDEFLNYCKEIKEFDFKSLEYSYRCKYQTWLDDGWKDGNGNKIKNWKTKIKNTAPFLKPIKPPQNNNLQYSI